MDEGAETYSVSACASSADDAAGTNRVFLSHSGQQKPFVERLFHELRGRAQIWAFYDRESIDPGCRGIKECIHDAIQNCELAVVVLSEEFLCSGKWPMMELSAFLKRYYSNSSSSGSPRNNSPGCSLKILPIFYHLSVAQLAEGIKSKKWMKKWRKQRFHQDLDMEGQPIKLEDWNAALRALKNIKGLEYARVIKAQEIYEKEGEYIGNIVDRICRLVPSDVYYKDSDVQGKDRLCQVIVNEFHRLASSPQIVGFYGMPGSGKTTLCQCMCNKFHSDFSGRVYYFELPSPIGNYKKQLDSKVLQELLDLLTNSRVTHETTKYSLREVRQQWEARIPQYPIFLAIDNVWQPYEDLVRIIIQSEFVKGSKVLISSCDKGVLQSSFGPKSYPILAIPSMYKDEALSLLLQQLSQGFVTPSNVGYWITFLDIPEELIYLCEQLDYHPYAMIILGRMLCNDDWPSSLTKKTDLEQLKNKLWRKRYNPVISLIDLSYDNLNDDTKEVFLDVVFAMLHETSPRRIEDVCKWVGILERELNTQNIMDKLDELLDSNFISVTNDGQSSLKMHHLFKEFGRQKLKDNPLYMCIFSNRDMSNLRSGDMSNDVKAIGVYGNRVLKEANLESCARTRALVLESCSSLTELNLCGMTSLAIIHVERCKSLSNIKCDRRSLSESLRILWYSDYRYGSPDEESSSHNIIDSGVSAASGYILPVNSYQQGGMLRGLWRKPTLYCFSALEDLSIGGKWVDDMSGKCKFDVLFPQLKRLEVTSSIKRIPELGKLTKLEVLHLWFHRGGNCSREYSATNIDLSGCSSLQAIKIGDVGDVRETTSAVLYADLSGCSNLNDVKISGPVVPKLSGLRRLQDVKINFLSNSNHNIQIHVDCNFDASKETLRRLELKGIPNREIDKFGCLTNLSFLEISEWPNLKTVPHDLFDPMEHNLTIWLDFDYSDALSVETLVGLIISQNSHPKLKDGAAKRILHRMEYSRHTLMRILELGTHSLINFSVWPRTCGRCDLLTQKLRANAGLLAYLLSHSIRSKAWSYHDRPVAHPLFRLLISLCWYGADISGGPHEPTASLLLAQLLDLVDDDDAQKFNLLDISTLWYRKPKFRSCNDGLFIDLRHLGDGLLLLAALVGVAPDADVRHRLLKLFGFFKLLKSLEEMASIDIQGRGIIFLYGRKSMPQDGYLDVTCFKEYGVLLRTEYLIKYRHLTFPCHRMGTLMSLVLKNTGSS